LWAIFVVFDFHIRYFPVQIAERVSTKSLSIAERIQLIKDGLTDVSADVRSIVATKLLREWQETLTRSEKKANPAQCADLSDVRMKSFVHFIFAEI
jgi:hypothetical protein